MLDQFEIDILVDLVVTRAKVDRTVPDPSNLRDGWRTDALFGDIDALVVGGKNNPSGYAEIGRRVLAQVKDLPEMAVLATLAILRGERLLSLTPEQGHIVLDISEDLKAAILALPDGTRKKRCQELFLYHMGVFYDASGRFDLAAETQEWAAREAGDKSSSAAISLFLSAVYRLKFALVADKPSDELEVIFSDLEEKSGQLAEALRGSELEVQWVEGNCPIHMIEACIWLDRRQPEWNNWVETAIAAAGKLGKAWEPSVEFVLAANIDEQEQGGVKEIEKALQAINAQGGSDEIKATVLLLLARRAFRAGNVDEAKKIIEQMPEQSVQHVRAIAERMLL